jgi:hypothetical protein
LLAAVTKGPQSMKTSEMMTRRPTTVYWRGGTPISVVDEVRVDTSAESERLDRSLSELAVLEERIRVYPELGTNELKQVGVGSLASIHFESNPHSTVQMLPRRKSIGRGKRQRLLVRIGRADSCRSTATAVRAIYGARRTCSARLSLFTRNHPR